MIKTVCKGTTKWGQCKKNRDLFSWRDESCVLPFPTLHTAGSEDEAHGDGVVVERGIAADVVDEDLAGPLAHEVGATVNCSDEVLMVGDRFYVVATAILTTYEGEQVAVQGWAREQDERKGMDASQVTGSASSYARKYALSGLFAIDDEKDADAQEPEQPKRKKAKKPDDLAQAKRDLMAAVKGYAERMGLDSKAIAGGIAERPDYPENKENAEWYRLITEEFKNG